MGTNYYLVKEYCKECGRGDELHIGKASAGWCFTLAIHTDLGIDSLDRWITLWIDPGNHIKDEYGSTIGSHEMISVIMLRENFAYTGHNIEWYQDNMAVRGPRGLARHKIDRFCVGHGDGPYDLVVGDFS